MDIKINSNEGSFKFRVCGILTHQNKVLVVKINNNKFYCLPGGHVELDESTDNAILREMKEELGFNVKIKKLISINQNFFKTETGLPFHELGFYYTMEAENPQNVRFEDYDIDELDKGKIQHLEFKWVTLNELKNLDFKPNFIIDAIENNELLINVTRD